MRVVVVKMASGVVAAVGAYRIVLLFMACAAAYGLHCGWVQPLFIGGIGSPELCLARMATLWIVLVVALWPIFEDTAIPMALCLMLISGLCMFAVAVVDLLVTV